MCTVSLTNDLTAQRAYQIATQKEMLAIRETYQKEIDRIMDEISQKAQGQQKFLELNYDIHYNIVRYLRFLGYQVKTSSCTKYFPIVISWYFDN